MTRRTDPRTSIAAANAARHFIPHHQASILAALELFGPMGKTRLGLRCGITDVAACRRVSELERAGLIVADGVEYSQAGRQERRFRLVEVKAND